MDGLLKRACDRCTRSKVKCSGHEPCKRCAAKGFACIYRPKKKRGPQKKRAGSTLNRSNAKKAAMKVDETYAFSVVSCYERRIWSVFFTIFKNQNRTREEHPWAWCWFASQLEKLRKHLVSQKNDGALSRLQVWLEALDMDQKSVNSLVVKKCTIDPSRCSACSSAAIGVESMNPVNGKAPSEWYPKSNIQAMQLGREKSASEGKAVLVFDASEDGSFVRVNELFKKSFGYDSDEMTALLHWSGGGFLPWGGDLLARLVVKEADLIIFLQILALKFQALGVPSHSENSCREVPSTHVFQIWSMGQQNEPGYIREYFLQCVHIERCTDGKIYTQMRIVFEPLGGPEKPKEEYPLIYKAPIQTEAIASIENKRKQNKDAAAQKVQVKLESDLSVDSIPALSPAQPDTLPTEFRQELSWDLFNYSFPSSDNLLDFEENKQNVDVRIPQQPVQEQPNTSIEFESLESDSRERSSAESEAPAADVPVDVDWLNSLLEWSVQQPIDG